MSKKRDIVAAIRKNPKQWINRDYQVKGAVYKNGEWQGQNYVTSHRGLVIATLRSLGLYAEGWFHRKTRRSRARDKGRGINPRIRHHVLKISETDVRSHSSD